MRLGRHKKKRKKQKKKAKQREFSSFNLFLLRTMEKKTSFDLKSVLGYSSFVHYSIFISIFSN